ncbi:MAG: thymidine phosphorylase [Candidatus Pacearchaeota archaeon]
MRLQIKILKVKTGKPVAFINEHSADKMGIRTGDRVILSKNGSNIIAVVDLAQGFVKKGEVAISEELHNILGSIHGFIEVTPAGAAESSRILQGKLECSVYSAKDLDRIMKDIVNNNLSEAEIAYFISGVSHCGMSETEILHLTNAIVKTGKRIKWPYKIVADKHSIGGIPANRTTPLVVSICAAAGVIMPKTSSRAITSAAGTADTVEAIAPVSLSIAQLKKVVQKTGACLAWGGSLGLAPADDKLIRIEKMLRLDPEAQLLASILAKKVAVGSTHVLIDIPYGHGAKVSKEKADHLKKMFEHLGKKLKLKIKVAVTEGFEPIGNGVGPILEIKDILRVLKQDNSPKDLEQKSIYLSGLIFEMVGKSRKGQGQVLAREMLYSGLAYEKFCEIIKAQGGDAKAWLKESKYNHTIISKHSGIIKKIDNSAVNYLARLTGCPSDKSCGVYLYKHVGEKINASESLITIYAESSEKLKDAVKFFKNQKPITIL